MGIVMLPLVVQVEDTRSDTAETFAFKRSPVRIGRNPLNDLQLQESFVSEWHAVVRFVEHRTSYLDLGATNRTLVDGKPLQRNVEVVISPDMDVRIGPLRLHLLRTEAPDELFGRRGKASAFAQAGVSEGGPSTLFLGADAALGQIASLLGTRAPAPSHAAVSAAPIDKSPRGPAPESVPVRSRAAQSESPAPSAHASYQVARAAFLREVSSELAAQPPDRRMEHALQLQQRHPELKHDPEFRNELNQLGIDPIRAGQPEMEDWLRRLTEGRFPPPGAPVNIALAMERVGEILEVFAQALIELRRAHERFCRELSLERYADDSLLQKTENPHALLAYLLDPHKDGAGRVTELSRALAEFALHDVGLLGAVVEGARSLLGKLSPQALRTAGDPPRDAAAFSQAGAVDRPWSFATRKHWRKYVVQHFELLQGDRFTRELFGREFARRYYVVTGGTNSAPNPSS
jgi:predicted component of type VI protein secretion system